MFFFNHLYNLFFSRNIQECAYCMFAYQFLISVGRTSLPHSYPHRRSCQKLIPCLVFYRKWTKRWGLLRCLILQSQISNSPPNSKTFKVLIVMVIKHLITSYAQRPLAKNLTIWTKILLLPFTRCFSLLLSGNYHEMPPTRKKKGTTSFIRIKYRKDTCTHPPEREPTPAP